MFGFLKDKLKDAVDKFSKKVEVEAEVEEEIEEQEEVVEETKKDISKKEKKEKKPKEDDSEDEEEDEPEEIEEKSESEEDEKEPVKEEKTEEVKVSEEKVDTEKETVEEEPKEEKTKKEAEEEKRSEKEEEKPKKGFLGRLFGKKEVQEKEDTVEEPEVKKEKPSKETEVKEEPITTEPEEEEKEPVKEEKPTEKPKVEDKVEKSIEEEETPEKRSVFSKLTDSLGKVQLSEKKFEELFWDLELAMLENNVAVEVIEKIKQDLKKDLTENKISRSNLQETILKTLRRSIEGLFDVETFDLVKKTEEKKPYVIVIVGVNGSGKTTTIAKLVKRFKDNDKRIVLGACDTFRAAAIQQLQTHADNLKVKVIKQDYGSDPAAVAFDTVKHAEAKDIDIVMIDTAGRLHSNQNLMAELKKIIRVVKPDMKIFVGESITGNDCVEQVKYFNKAVGIDAIILAKADVDDKGGAAISVSYVTGKPILYIGTGQGYDDLEEFSKEKVIEQIGL